MVALALTGCGDAAEVVGTINSPNGDIALTVKKSDLGACCTSRLFVSGTVFGNEAEGLAEIGGAGDVRYEWIDPVTLAIVACNATEASFRSGFQNADFTRRFILSVENERPVQDGDRVECSSDRFERMTPL